MKTQTVKDQMNRLFMFAAVIFSILITGVTNAQTKETPIKNVVLVHGAFVDGSGWKGVYKELTKKGYNVTIVQNPLTSLEDDVAATNLALDKQDWKKIW